MTTGERTPIFVPDPASIARSQMTAFMRYCEAETGRIFADYAAFHDFSVQEFRSFWRLFFHWCGLRYEGDVVRCTSGIPVRAGASFQTSDSTMPRFCSPMVRG